VASNPRPSGTNDDRKAASPMRPLSFSADSLQVSVDCGASPLLDLSQGGVAGEVGQSEHQKRGLVP
jgi:hypothetical protein